MVCLYCQTEYNIRDKFIAKSCDCDDEQRFISFEEWYYDTFIFDVYSSDSSSSL